jgi:hypothetical protein
VNAASTITLCIFFCSALNAESVFTQNGRLDGNLVRQNEKEIVIQPKGAAEIILNRNEVLTLYDDEGNLIWSHPSIVRNDPTPETATKIELPAPEPGSAYRGLHVGVSGSFGLIWPSGIVSNFPLGTTIDYNYGFEIAGTSAWYYGNNQALIFGLGYARRNMPIAGIIEHGVVSNGYWPMDYLDVRIGHRSHSGIFFIEPGLLTAVNLTKAPLTVNTASGTWTNNSYGTPTYLALYFSMGASFPITRQIFGLCSVRVEHGISPAVTGAAPTATDVSGNVLSTAPINLVPFGVSFQLSATWRFDLPAGW